MKVYLVRHAESTGNLPEEKRPSDHVEINPCLSDTGLKQADLLGKRFAGAKFDAIITSPLTRTMQTTAAITAYLDNPTVYVWGDLMERNTHPDFPGLSLEECKAIYENVAPLFDGSIGKPLGTESERQLFMRGQRIIDYLERNFPQNSEFLIVSHGTFNRYIFNSALNLPCETLFFFGQTNTSVSLFSTRESDGTPKRRLHYLNDLSHLYRTELQKDRI